MKSSGIQRKIDDLGRIVIPAPIRKTLGIREGDALDVSVDGDTIFLTKAIDRCTFCGARDDLQPFRGRLLCRSCVGDLGVLRDAMLASGVTDGTSAAEPAIAASAPTPRPSPADAAPRPRPQSVPPPAVRQPAAIPQPAAVRHPAPPAAVTPAPPAAELRPRPPAAEVEVDPFVAEVPEEEPAPPPPTTLSTPRPPRRYDPPAASSTAW